MSAPCWSRRATRSNASSASAVMPIPFPDPGPPDHGSHAQGRHSGNRDVCLHLAGAGGRHDPTHRLRRRLCRSHSPTQGRLIMDPTPKAGILEIETYVGGVAHVAGVEKVFKLSSNESATGASPLAIAAFKSVAQDLDLYPDGSVKLLRDAIAETYGLDAARIVCGNGSGELLTMLSNAYLRPGDEVLFSAHAFLLYKIDTLANSAAPVRVPEKNLPADVDAMLARSEE